MMSMTKRTVFAALLVSALGGAALAQEGPMGGMMGGGMGDGPMGGPMMEGGPFGGFDFAAVDADKDGKITEAEMQAAGLFVVTETAPSANGTVSIALTAYDARMYEAD